ncbi:hypothetical protein FSP39_013975, partial [Pinctada imbricata]
GYDIPEGTIVVINILALHMDPAFWKNVTKFDPSHFIKDGKLNLKADNWLPFSAGKRCLTSDFNLTYRYIDGVQSINNANFADYLSRIYHSKLEGKETKLQKQIIQHPVRTRIKYKLPPMPRGIPILGNWKVYTSKCMYSEAAKLTKTYGPVIRISIGMKELVFLNNYETVMEALLTKKVQFAGRPQTPQTFISTDGSQSIGFSQHNEEWWYRKKVAGKAFRTYILILTISTARFLSLVADSLVSEYPFA